MMFHESGKLVHGRTLSQAPPVVFHLDAGTLRWTEPATLSVRTRRRRGGKSQTKAVT
jgi:hypothetical protein